MRITLNHKDLYELSLTKINIKAKKAEDICKTLKKAENVPVENLRSTFTDMTGLYTSLSG